ncbi:hypothetical protein S40293_03139 [Stachybotrys chartarum IBT 40293]|nr:hypothetical protein S40293_03139 [Stachybotrys chartarum IBT 40293]
MASHGRDTTPSSPRMPYMPPAPRLGAWQDNWEPYPARKSSRLSQRTANKTPSPPASPVRQSSSTTVSPTRSPQKKSQRTATSSSRAQAKKAAEAAANTAEAHMLPTPSKTPRKAPHADQVRQIASVARSLFAQSPLPESPLPKKMRNKKYSGMSMESFKAEDVEEDIDIFIDAENRSTRYSVPKKDASQNNPFRVTAIPSESTPRRSKRRKVLIPGEGVVPVEEAVKRSDGRVMVFRGRKVWSSYEDGALRSDLSSVSRKLFQTKSADLADEEDEAETDVEHPELTDVEEAESTEVEEAESLDDPQTPAEPLIDTIRTPKAPKFAPVSPPDTRRTTRFANKLSRELSSKEKTDKGRPFDSWQRVKETKEAPSLKRQASDLTAASPKRLRARKYGDDVTQATSQ